MKSFVNKHFDSEALFYCSGYKQIFSCSLRCMLLDITHVFEMLWNILACNEWPKQQEIFEWKFLRYERYFKHPSQSLSMNVWFQRNFYFGFLLDLSLQWAVWMVKALFMNDQKWFEAKWNSTKTIKSLVVISTKCFDFKTES